MSKRQDTIKTLVAGGKSKEVKELIDSKSAVAANAYQQIAENESLSETGKNFQYAVAYVQINRDVTNALETMARSVVRTDRDDAERVFGVKGLSGDAASLVISRRDAADRVVRVENRDELRDLLTRATRSGDEVLARAVAERAVRDQDDKTMNQFLADRPELDAAGERLWKAERASGNAFAMNVSLMGLRPSELSHLHEDSIEALAHGAAPTTAAGF